MVKKQIILASASPRRRELLARAGLAFTVRPSEIEEAVTRHSAEEAVEELAEQKAADIFAKTEGERLVIGSDTVVVLDGKILGKPADAGEAHRMLQALQGRTHQVCTGVALLWERDGTPQRKVFHSTTEVSVYPMTEEEICRYIATGEPMDKAGAYGIQGAFCAYIREICGDYHSVVGLPVGRLVHEMKELKLEEYGRE